MSSYYEIMRMLGDIVPEQRENGQILLRLNGTDHHFTEEDLMPIQVSLERLMTRAEWTVVDGDL